MARFIDIEGQRFGRLLVLEFAGISARRLARWKCQCDCGKLTTTTGKALRSGETTSCGCYHREVVASRIGNLRATHRCSGTKEHRAWSHMIGRCENPNDSAYPHYGARGITVCARWRASFEAFLFDMGKAPGPSMSLDRIDVNGHYEPGNCRWATRTEQARNTRCNTRVACRGALRTISEWAEISGNPSSLISARLKRGTEAERAIFSPPRKGNYRRGIRPTHS